MSVGVYLCSCGGAVGASLPTDALATAVLALPEVAYVEQLEIACGGADLAAMRASLAARRPDRVVVAACSVREHEATFQQALEDAGMNPFLVHLVNVREQVAWVTPDPARAVEKATAQIRAGVARVREQRPLERRTFPVETGVIDAASPIILPVRSAVPDGSAGDACTIAPLPGCTAKTDTVPASSICERRFDVFA